MPSGPVLLALGGWPGLLALPRRSLHPLLAVLLPARSLMEALPLRRPRALETSRRPNALRPHRLPDLPCPHRRADAMGYRSLPSPHGGPVGRGADGSPSLLRPNRRPAALVRQDSGPRRLSLTDGVDRRLPLARDGSRWRCRMPLLPRPQAGHFPGALDLPPLSSLEALPFLPRRRCGYRAAAMADAGRPQLGSGDHRSAGRWTQGRSRHPGPPHRRPEDLHLVAAELHPAV